MLLNNNSNTGSNVSLNLQAFPLFFIRFAYAGNPLAAQIHRHGDECFGRLGNIPFALVNQVDAALYIWARKLIIKQFFSRIGKLHRRV